MTTQPAQHPLFISRPIRCPRSRPFICVLVLAMAAGLGTAQVSADVEATASHFAVDATLRPLAVSVCGRFAMDATARFTPEATSTDGRYSLKSVNTPSGGCDPQTDRLFGDGFEPL